MITFLIPLAGGLLILAGGRAVRWPRAWLPLALGVLAGSAAWQSGLLGARPTVPASPASWLIDDAFTRAIEWLAVALGVVILPLGAARGQPDAQSADRLGLTLVSLAGLMLAAAANDLVLVFVAVELVSFCAIVSGWCGQGESLRTESILQSLAPAALSSLLLLTGLTLIYGLTTSTNLAAIHAVLAASYVPADASLAVGRGSLLGVTAVVLVFAGLGGRLAVVPFDTGRAESWTSDLRSAALTATVPRAAAFVVLVRVVVDGLPGFEAPARQVASLLAGLTMVVAGVRGLSRSDPRQMAADLIVLQGGFLLMGVAAALALPSSLEAGGSGGGAVAAAVLVLAISLIATAGLLGVLLSLNAAEGGLRGLDDLSGLARTHPVVAICLTLSLLALAGVPPVVGFWGRWSVVLAALSAPAEATALGTIGLDAGFVVLTFAAALGTLLAAAVVVRWLEPVLLVGPLGRPRPAAQPAAAAAVLACVAIAASSVLPGDALRLFDGTGRRGAKATTSPPPAGTSVAGPARLRRLEEPAAAPAFLDDVDPHRSGASRTPADERRPLRIGIRPHVDVAALQVDTDERARRIRRAR